MGPMAKRPRPAYKGVLGNMGKSRLCGAPSMETPLGRSHSRRGLIRPVLPLGLTHPSIFGQCRRCGVSEKNLRDNIRLLVKKAYEFMFN